LKSMLLEANQAAPSEQPSSSKKKVLYRIGDTSKVKI